GLREAAGGPAVVDDAGAPGRGVEDRLHGVCGPAVAAAVEDLQVHHAGAPRDTRDAHGVVALGGDDAGHVGAVAVVVERVGEVIGEVVAVHVVDVAVVVVVDEVAGDLARVGPEVGHQVRMADIHARVEHGDKHRRITGRDVPGGLGPDVDPRQPE